MNQATREFVLQHANDDVRQLALKKVKNPEIDLPLALDQIKGRQTARTKIPTWAQHDGILYPSHLSMEQCSSEKTARYKAKLIRQLTDSFASFIDLTGGLGVDFSMMASSLPACACVYVEQQATLCDLASHNFQALGLSNTEVVHADGVEFLHQLDHATVIFLDPARRDSHGGRTYAIGDCTPDVLLLRNELLQKADIVMLKLSPMLDWHEAVRQLNREGECVREVHIVSIGNECKELLLILGKQEKGKACRVVCVNDEESFSFPVAAESAASSIDRESLGWRMPVSGDYLYEPNASVMKAGCFMELSATFGVRGLGVNSHLFIADRLMGDFPGRKFQVQAVSSMNKKELQEKLQGIGHANITTRNFPMRPEELRRRLKIKDGGEVFIFATTLYDGTFVLIISKKA